MRESGIPLTGPSFPGVGNDCTPLFGTPFTVSCYDPKEMREAYNVPAPSVLNGAGQTIIECAPQWAATCALVNQARRPERQGAQRGEPDRRPEVGRSA
jgi:hypothetical protein